MSALAPTLQAFFTDRLARQRRASPHTVAAYRDTFRLLLSFVSEHHGRPPAQLGFEDIDVTTITAFLDHLETDRGNSARTRNARLAAIRSLFRYAALRHPEHADLIGQVLAIPQKRHDKGLVPFLTHDEIDALLEAPDRSSWEGRRDRALLLVAAQAGLRVTELADLNCADVTLGTGPYIRCHGKGRKERVTPLTTQTVAVLRVWMAERQGLPDDPLFPTRTGRRLTRDAIKHRVAQHATVIALWLGHEDVQSTQMYVHADMTMKERALARTAPHGAPPGRYRAPDTLLAFLESL